jgi:hypothetical protein
MWISVFQNGIFVKGKWEGVMMLVPDNPKHPPLQPSADLQIVGVGVEAIKSSNHPRKMRKK